MSQANSGSYLLPSFSPFQSSGGICYPSNDYRNAVVPAGSTIVSQPATGGAKRGRSTKKRSSSKSRSKSPKRGRSRTMRGGADVNFGTGKNYTPSNYSNTGLIPISTGQDLFKAPEYEKQFDQKFIDENMGKSFTTSFGGAKKKKTKKTSKKSKSKSRSSSRKPKKTVKRRKHLGGALQAPRNGTNDNDIYRRIYTFVNNYIQTLPQNRGDDIELLEEYIDNNNKKITIIKDRIGTLEINYYTAIYERAGENIINLDLIGYPEFIAEERGLIQNLLERKEIPLENNNLEFYQPYIELLLNGNMDDLQIMFQQMQGGAKKKRSKSRKPKKTVKRRKHRGGMEVENIQYNFEPFIKNSIVFKNGYLKRGDQIKFKLHGNNNIVQYAFVEGFKENNRKASAILISQLGNDENKQKMILLSSNQSFTNQTNTVLDADIDTIEVIYEGMNEKGNMFGGKKKKRTKSKSKSRSISKSRKIKKTVKRRKHHGGALQEPSGQMNDTDIYRQIYNYLLNRGITPNSPNVALSYRDTRQMNTNRLLERDIYIRNIGGRSLRILLRYSGNHAFASLFYLEPPANINGLIREETIVRTSVLPENNNINFYEPMINFFLNNNHDDLLTAIINYAEEYRLRTRIILVEEGGAKKKRTKSKSRSRSPSKKVKKSKKTKKSTKRRVMRGGEESWGQTYNPPQFNNASAPIPDFPANSGKGAMSAYGTVSPNDIGVGMLAPYNTNPDGNQASMQKTGGAKKKRTKSKSRSRSPSRKVKKSKKTKKSTKRRVMRGGEESWGQTYNPPQFYNASAPISDFAADSGKGMMTAYGEANPRDVGVGMLAPYNANPAGNQSSMQKTGGGKKKRSKSKSKKSMKKTKKSKKSKKTRSKSRKH